MHQGTIAHIMKIDASAAALSRNAQDIGRASNISPFANGNSRKRNTSGSMIHIQGFMRPPIMDVVNACQPVSGVPVSWRIFVAGRKNDRMNKSQDPLIIASETRVKV